jgi:uncharacterized protein
MKWRSSALVIHRDLGYFFTGVIVIYAVSGLAVNHADDWDANFIVEERKVMLDLPRERYDVTEEQVRTNLVSLGAAEDYRSHDFPSPQKIKIYLVNGSILARLSDGQGTHETIRRRPVLYHLNALHLNPAKWWKIFSDVFAVALILIVITGLLLPRGRQGLAGRGKWLVGAGIIAPLAALMMV